MPPRCHLFARSSAFAAVLSGLAAGAGPAAAQPFEVGAVAGPSRGRVDCVAAFPCDRTGTHAALTAAWRFAEPWDVQLALFSGGRFRGGDPIPAGGTFGGTFRVEGVGLTAGYRWAFAPDWSLVGRLGAAAVRTRFAYAAPYGGDASKTTVQPLAGLGVEVALTPAWRIGLAYDATRFEVHTRTGSLRMLGVAARHAF
jgi:hypothetical protein